MNTKVRFPHGVIVLLAVVELLMDALWFSPVMFASRWMALSRVTEADAAKFPGWGFALAIGASVIMGYGIAWLIDKFQTITPMSGARLGLLLWGLLCLPHAAVIDTFSIRSLWLTLINHVPHGLWMALSGACIAWRLSKTQQIKQEHLQLASVT